MRQFDPYYSSTDHYLPPSVRTVLPPGATKVKEPGRPAALMALTRPVIAAMENFILYWTELKCDS